MHTTLSDTEVYPMLQAVCTVNVAHLLVWFGILKPQRKGNGVFTTLHSSKELIKQFVLIYSQISLCWQKKRSDMTFIREFSQVTNTQRE